MARNISSDFITLNRIVNGGSTYYARTVTAALQASQSRHCECKKIDRRPERIADYDWQKYSVILEYQHVAKCASVFFDKCALVLIIKTLSRRSRSHDSCL